MEVGVSSSGPVARSYGDVSEERKDRDEEKDRSRVKRKTLLALLEQCQRALELISKEDDDAERYRDRFSVASPGDREGDELCELKSRVECSDFLEKLECAKVSIPQNVSEEGSSWDLVCSNDLWEAEGAANDEDYVLVRQEDMVEDMTYFMTAYLLSLKQTKDLTPNQLQEALSKTFSVKKKKGKLRMMWDGSKVIYNVASWGVTAIGIYHNPVQVKAAAEALWTSCRLISKLL